MSQEIKFKEWQMEYFKDEKLMKVFLSVTTSPKSAKVISNDTGVSLTTVYRKIRKLREQNLVAISGQISEDGRRSFLYSRHD